MEPNEQAEPKLEGQLVSLKYTSALPAMSDIEEKLKIWELQFGKETTLLLVDTFVKETRDIIDATDGALGKKDFEVVGQCMHKLAGCCASTFMGGDWKKRVRAVEEMASHNSLNSISEKYFSLRDSLLRTVELLGLFTQNNSQDLRISESDFFDVPD